MFRPLGGELVEEDGAVSELALPWCYLFNTGPTPSGHLQHSDLLQRWVLEHQYTETVHGQPQRGKR